MFRDQGGWRGRACAGLTIRRSGVRVPGGAPGRLHISGCPCSRLALTFALPGPASAVSGPGLILGCWSWPCAYMLTLAGWWGVLPGLGVRVAGRRVLWRDCGERGEGGAAAAPGPGREPGGGAPGGVGLAGVPGVEDALVAEGEQAGQPQRERGQGPEAAPTAGGVVAGGGPGWGGGGGGRGGGGGAGGGEWRERGGGGGWGQEGGEVRDGAAVVAVHRPGGVQVGEAEIALVEGGEVGVGAEVGLQAGHRVAVAGHGDGQGAVAAGLEGAGDGQGVAGRLGGGRGGGRRRRRRGRAGGGQGPAEDQADRLACWQAGELGEHPVGAGLGGAGGDRSRG